MTIQQARDVLINYNNWRRGAEIEQPDPKEIGKAIDLVTEFLKDK